jgi:phosphoenolpyruvate carboxykinase (ATP)
MKHFGRMADNANLNYLGLSDIETAYWNLDPAELTEDTIINEEGLLTNTGALAIDTGEFTGRSPQDRFIVEDDVTRETVWWGDVNKKFDAGKFDQLQEKMVKYLAGKEVFVRDAYVGADEKYRLKLRLVAEFPWSSMFAYNMFLRPEIEELKSFSPEWHIINAPGFMADAAVDGTRQHNFAVISFSKKTILIGGTGYTGEIKKGMFSVMNFILPHEHNVLSMHCSANTGEDGDTSIFFGLKQLCLLILKED